MNQAAGSKSKKHAMWDEQNLAENEKIKAELAPVKITEPKTPYHQPLSHLDAELGLEPLALDENIDGHVIHHAGDPAHPEWEEDGHGGQGKGFSEARKAHYNMKEIMAKAREQAAKDLEEADEEEEKVAGK